MDNRLGAQVVPPEPEPAERDAHSQARRRRQPARRLALKLGEEPAQPRGEEDHLAAEAPDAAADGPDAAHQPRRHPRGAQLDDGAARAREADVQRRVPDGEQECDHLP